jgi:hypothetical protein
MANSAKTAPNYEVELLCRERPTINKKSLLRALKKRRPDMDDGDPDPSSNLPLFRCPAHPTDKSLGHVKILVAVRDAPPDPRNYEPALQQSWQFPEARTRSALCRAAVVVNFKGSSSLPREKRLELYQDCVAAAVELVPCEAVCWAPSGRMVDPQTLLANLADGDYPRLFNGAVNVRLINVAGSPGALVMDTVGLAWFDVPDVQCHFKQLDPNLVGPHLYDLALYLFKRGDVIRDGQTVDGIPKGAQWRCHHEPSMTKLAREVLDLDPGPPFAVGRTN